MPASYYLWDRSRKLSRHEPAVKSSPAIRGASGGCHRSLPLFSESFRLRRARRQGTAISLVASAADSTFDLAHLGCWTQAKAIAGQDRIEDLEKVTQPPVIAAIANQTGVAGSSIKFTGVASDPDLPEQRLVFSLAGGSPLGAGAHPDSGEFSWTPTAEQIGTCHLPVLVTWPPSQVLNRMPR